nr:hypothetical protein [Bradyrhizobium shewense]
MVADLAEPQVKAMHQAGRVDWDIAYIEAEAYPAMHKAGMFEPIDYSLWDQEALEGAPPHTRRKDAVVGLASAIVLAYDQRPFRELAPKTGQIFGTSRSFRDQGVSTLSSVSTPSNLPSWPPADGHKDIWPLTDDKLDRAFAKLNEIKPHITKWWSAGGEAPPALDQPIWRARSMAD